MKPYEKYVPSGVEWIGDIPEGWEVKRFRYFFSTSKGLTITKSELVDDGIPCVNYGEIHSKYGFDLDVTRDELRYAPFEFLETQKGSLIYNNDFVFCDTSEDVEGSGNNTLISNTANKDLFAGSHTVIAHPFKKANYRCLAYLFSTIEWRSQIRKKVSGVKVYSITQNILKSTTLVLPSIEVQGAIANYLDTETARIDNIIKAKEVLIERLKEKRTALISHAVTKGIDPNAQMKSSGVEWIGDIPEGWEVKKLKYIVKTKITDGPHTTPELIPDGVPFISAEAVKNNKINLNLIRGYISNDDHKLFCMKCKPQKNDIFMIKSGATTGNIAMVDFETEFSIWSPLALIRSNEKRYKQRYIFYSLLSDCFSKQVTVSWSFGTQQNIGMGVIENLVIFAPSIEQQQAIADYLDTETQKIDSIIDKTKLSIEKLKEYRTAIISACVTGKIDVRSV